MRHNIAHNTVHSLSYLHVSVDIACTVLYCTVLYQAFYCHCCLFCENPPTHKTNRVRTEGLVQARVDNKKSNALQCIRYDVIQTLKISSECNLNINAPTLCSYLHQALSVGNQTN